MDAPPPTPTIDAVAFSIDADLDHASSDFDFDLPELDYDDPYNSFGGDDDSENAFDRRDRRIHAWLHQQCRFALSSPQKGKTREQEEVHPDGPKPNSNLEVGYVLCLKHKASSRTMLSAVTGTEEETADELEDARADSPLLGFPRPDDIDVDKPLPVIPPPSPPPKSPGYLAKHSPSSSQSSVRRSPSTSSHPSRRPSVLRQPSLPLLAETSVLQLSEEEVTIRARTQSNASVASFHLPTSMQPPAPVLLPSPLPPASPPTRRQSRAPFSHAPSASISSTLSLSALGSPNIDLAPLALSHASSSLSLSMQNPSMRHAVYIDSEEVRERLDELLYLQAQRPDGEERDDADPEDDGQDVEIPLDLGGTRSHHQTQLSNSSISINGMGSSDLFTPPPSAASTRLTMPMFYPPPPPPTRTNTIAPPNTPMTVHYQSPYASSSQVYLGLSSPNPNQNPSPAASASQSTTHLHVHHAHSHSTPPTPGTPHSHVSSGSLSLGIPTPVPISLPPLCTTSKPPTRPPPAPPLVIEPGLVGASVSVPVEDVERRPEEHEREGDRSELAYAGSNEGTIENLQGEMRRRSALLLGAGNGSPPGKFYQLSEIGHGLTSITPEPGSDTEYGQDALEVDAGVEVGAGREGEGVVDGEGEPGRDDFLSAPSMSRWSLASSTMDVETSGSGLLWVPGTASGKKDRKEKEKEKKRKSFVAGVLGTSSPPATTPTAGGEAVLFPAGSPTSTKDNAKDKDGKDKKRSRLASFISRLSGVGIPASNGKEKEDEDVPPVPTLLPPAPIWSNGAERDGQRPSLKVKVSTDRLGMGVRDEEINLAGAVKGVWDGGVPTSTISASTSGSSQQPATSTSTLKSVPNSPTAMWSPDMLPPVPRMPPPLPPGPSPLMKAASEGLVGGLSETMHGRARSNSGANPNPNYNAGYGVSQIIRPRPALVKSASASLLSSAGRQSQHQQRQQVFSQHFYPQRQYAPPSSRRQNSKESNYCPLTPSSEMSTEDEDDEEEEDYGEVQPRPRDVEGLLEGNDRPETERETREREHEERWTRVKWATERQEQQQQPLSSFPVPPSQVPPNVDADTSLGGPSANVVGSSMLAELQRHRLRSMSSLGNLNASAGMAASSTGVALTQDPRPPLAGERSQSWSSAKDKESKDKDKSSKGRGFRGLVERMGFASSSSSAPSNTNPVVANLAPEFIPTSSSSSASSGFPPTPPTIFQNPNPFNSTSIAPSPSYSPGHSPSTSISGIGGSGAGLFDSVRKSTKKQPKRRLVISGVKEEDDRAYEAVKAWCESFGEIREMRRTANGSLHVDFRKASVAETVCRVQAGVFIKGVGSVSLSWSTKKRVN